MTYRCLSREIPCFPELGWKSMSNSLADCVGHYYVLSRLAARLRPVVGAFSGDILQPRSDAGLDFSAAGHLYATHQMHTYAAKCPAPLVRWALEEYSSPFDTVVDPMVGSGTSALEGLLLGRRVTGFDIDPLARLIASAKVARISGDEVAEVGRRILDAARSAPDPGWRPAGIDVTRWFRDDVAADLARLRDAISNASIESGARTVMLCLFSSLVVARTSVANVRDIAHSRHHFEARPRDPRTLDRFGSRVATAKRLFDDRDSRRQPNGAARVAPGDARQLKSVKNDSVDLYFTSPPYCSALDYTRAHIFSVAWLADLLGTTTEAYRDLGRDYVGSERAPLTEATSDRPDPPTFGESRVDSLVKEVLTTDRVRAWILYKYFRDMDLVLREAGRVVRPGGHAIFVVCPSNIRNIPIPTDELFCRLAERDTRLELKLHSSRTIHDRRRLMPYREQAFGKRMRTEYVLVWQKRAGDLTSVGQ
jgi:site-specific DNA-methyltransferase (cytosine-N4-specific)